MSPHYLLTIFSLSSHCRLTVASLSPNRRLRDVVIDAEDAARIGAVLVRGEPPRGDIWSFERGLDA